MASFSAWRTAGSNTCRTMVLLPEPLTPATTVIRPTGIVRVASFRLWARAPRSLIHRSASPRGARGGWNESDRARAVGEAGSERTSFGVPWATM